ncbi:MAG: hypothetical protein ACR65O_16075 [Methylomicrobium sp.]|jgi:hypothetical protein
MKYISLAFTMGTGLLIFTTTFSTGVSALTITPMQGQTPDQIQRDQADCTSIAQQAAGSQTQSAPPPSGGRARGAAAGAMAGTAKAEAKGRQYGAYDNVNDDIKQEYRQNEAKSAAAAGAAVGAARQRQQRRQDSQQSAASSQSFDQAFGSCLMGRGYSVQ